MKAMSPDQVMLPASVVSLAESGSRETKAADGSTEDPAPSGSLRQSEDAESLLVPLAAAEPLAASSTAEDGGNGEGPKLSFIQTIGRFFAAVPMAVWLAAAAALAVAVGAGSVLFLKQRNRQKEDEARMIRRQRRLERLQEAGISTEQFEFMVQQKRSLASKRTGHVGQDKGIG